MSQQAHQETKAAHGGYGRVYLQTIEHEGFRSITHGDRAVMLVILAHADRHDRSTVGMRRIAELTGMQIGSVSRAVQHLDDAGLIRVDRQGNGSRFVYHIAPQTVHRGANGQEGEPFTEGRTVSEADRSPCGAEPFTVRRATVHPVAQNRSPSGEHVQHEQRFNNHEQHGRQPMGHGVQGTDRRKPNLPHIEPADLNQTGKMLDHFAVTYGCPRPTSPRDIEACLLRFFAAAEHAASVQPKNGKPIKNRAALFASMIRAGDFVKITEADEQRAVDRLKRHFNIAAEPREQPYDPRLIEDDR